MKIGISTVAYNQTDPLVKMINSAHQTQHEIEMRIFMHSQNQEVREICHSAVSDYGAILYDIGYNRGLSIAWNDALIAMRDSGCDVSMLVNDDLWFEDGDIDKIAQAAVEHPLAYAIFCSGFHVGFNTPINCHGMSCFAIQPIALDTIGFYDENFFPAYNEDVDYARRAAAAGLQPFIVPDTNVHHIGSAAIKKSPNLASQNHATHHYNNLYWQNKWGCEVSENPELGYRHPFNNRHFHPYFISEDKRHTPYAPYNRTDRDRVVI